MPESCFGFDPRSPQSIAELLQECNTTVSLTSHNRIAIHLESDNELSLQCIGRLTIINGRCRSLKIRVTLHTTCAVWEQLNSLCMDRVITTEVLSSPETNQG